MKKIILIIVSLLFAANSYAKTRIDITRGNSDPLPIASLEIKGKSEEEKTLGINITKVIEADLIHSGLFRIIDKDAYIENPNITQIPNFSAWRQINAQAVSVGSIKITQNEIEIEFRLWDPFAEGQLTGKAFAYDKSKWRRISHIIADEIYKALTGEDGYFDTRIAYVAESGPALKRIKRIASMDFDGHNHRFETDGRNIALTPRFSNNSNQILYLSYVNKKPRVYVRDLATGREKMLGEWRGMSYAPRYSPDGSKVILSEASNGNSDIYVIDLNSLSKTRLTNDPAIDVSASYSPDGKKITFNSDRGGSRQIYVMNHDGSNQKRISFGDGFYTTPVWSPRGDFIAFTKSVKGKGFHIGVMRPDGTGERLLTQGYLVEGPSWSPNGRVIIFTRGEAGKKGNADKSRLYTIDLTGYNEREIITPIDGSDPAWSPLLK